MLLEGLLLWLRMMLLLLLLIEVLLLLLLLLLLRERLRDCMCCINLLHIRVPGRR